MAGLVHLNLLTLSNTGGSQTEAFGRITERLGMSEGGGGFLLLCMLLLLLNKQNLITTITENTWRHTYMYVCVSPTRKCHGSRQMFICKH